MATDDSGGATENGDEDEVPPPKIIKIEDLADVNSPYPSLDGEILARREGVAVVRMDAESITSDDGDGVLIGKSVADFTYIIGELGGRRGSVRVREVAFRHSVDLAFTTAGEIVDTLEGTESQERRGARRLLSAFASLDIETLLKVLSGVDESLAVRLEELLHLLVEYRATLDMQISRDARPIRVRPERAYALYSALREPTTLPRRSFPAAGRLVGATADTRDFKLRLREPWNRKVVIEGKFLEGLEPEIERLFNREVLADVVYDEIRRGVRGADYRFTLEGLQASPRLPFNA